MPKYQKKKKKKKRRQSEWFTLDAGQEFFNRNGIIQIKLTNLTMAGNRNDGKSEDKKKSSVEGQDPVLTSIFSKINLLTEEVNNRAAYTDTILQTLSTKFNSFTDSITEVKEDLGHLKSEFIKEKRESRRHDAKLGELERKLEFGERDSRRSNIVLDGVEENKDRSLFDILQDLLEDLQVSFGSNDCDKIFRRRKQTPREGYSPSPRPIVIVFVRLCYNCLFVGLV